MMYAVRLFFSAVLSLVALETFARTEGSRRFSVTPHDLNALAQGASRVSLADFPISTSRNGKLELRKLRSAIDRSTRIEVTGRDGTESLSGYEIIAYAGQVAGEDGSHVELSILNGALVGAIELAGIKYIIAPEFSAEGHARHTITEQSAIYEDRGNTGLKGCEAEYYDHRYGQGFTTQPSTPQKLPATLLQVSIALDADYNFFKSTGGDVNKTISYIGTIFNFVSMIYENEANITLHIPYIKIWTDSLIDPYQVAGNPFAMVEKVERYWKLNHTGIKRDIVHGLTSTLWGGGGYALFKTLCGNYAYGCSAPCGWLTYPTFDYTYDVYIIAHELGHNFGAVHSHHCEWNPPLDTCGVRNDDQYNYGDACFEAPVEPKANPGSIMSYCLQINSNSGVPFNKLIDMTFTPKVAAVIRQAAEEATCIGEANGPTLVLRSPRGNQSYHSGERQLIEWSHAKVTNVSSSYTYTGSSWLPIASMIPASSGSYEWTIPPVSMPSVGLFLRITSEEDPLIGDTSLIQSSIVAAVASQDRASAIVITIHPNPAAERANCTISLPQGMTGAVAMLQIVDGLGRVLHEQHSTFSSGVLELPVDIEVLPSGAYTLRVSCGTLTGERSFYKR